MEDISITRAHRALDRDTAARDAQEAAQERAHALLAETLLDPRHSETDIVERLLGRTGADELLLDLLIMAAEVSPDGDTDVAKRLQERVQDLIEARL